VRLLARVVLLIGVVFVVAVLLWFLSSSITASLVRFVIAAVMGIAIAVFGIGFFRQMGETPPDPPAELVPAEYRLAYVCEVCGLELTVHKVARDKPPKHCSEEMVLVPREV
jgi:hypothetical protein